MPIFLLLLCLAACGHVDTDVPEPMPPDQQLAAKFDAYLALNAAYPHGPHAWDNEDDCDALLFASLTAAARNEVIDIESARDGNGAWHRNPSQSCYPDRSGSTVSRDMFDGLFWYSRRFDRQDIARQVFAYGKDKTWIMGKGSLGATFMTPNQQSTLGLLTGEDHILNGIQPAYDSDVTGYQAHLVALDLALRLRLGHATGRNREVAQALVAKAPRNALFQAVLGLHTGDQTAAVALLLEPQYWPADRLPTSADRCEPWLTQRDDGPDWQPCAEGKTHSGGDFLFAAALALGKL